MEIVITVFYIIVCVLLFALAILIHEFGHFIVALKLGLRVEAFSIGFGPAIWKKTVNGVEYRIGPIPLGGYVAIPDVDPEGTKALEGEKTKADGERPKVKIPAWKEILVAFAGPAMNVVLALALAIGLACVPNAKFGELSTLVADVLPGSPAAQGGLIGGDRILSVSGHAVSSWTELMTEIQIQGGKEMRLAVSRPDPSGEGAASSLVLQLAAKKDEISGAYYIGAIHTNDTQVGHFLPARNPLKQLAWDAGSIFRVLKGLVTPKEAAATSKALGGPVMIAEGLYRQVRRDPWDGLGFLRFLNVNLAVLNLLPIPVLDGGLILFALFALVFRRRIPEIIVKYLSLGFMVVLIGLMGLLICRDANRSWKIHHFKPTQTNETANATSQSR